MIIGICILFYIVYSFKNNIKVNTKAKLLSTKVSRIPPN